MKGRTYRRLAVGKNGKIFNYWVEGIGLQKSNCYMSPLVNTILRTVGREANFYGVGSASLVAVYQDGELIFEKEDFEVAGTPANISAVNDLSSEQTSFDLTGKRVSEPQKGVYIKNGKKVVK